MLVEKEARIETPLLKLRQEELHLAIYINNVETLEEYVAKLSVCVSARELALVVDAMVWDSAVKVDRDTAVMQEFIRVLLPLAPHVTTGINNIRKQINNLLCKSRKDGGSRKRNMWNWFITLPPHTISCLLSPPHANQAVCSC